MQILEKVTVTPYICGIELDFAGELLPSFSETTQPFYNSSANALTWNKTYISIKSISFRETSKEDKNQNTAYTQKLSFKFPSNDTQRAERIELLRKVKFIKLMMNNDTSLVIGRNDYNQNKLPNFSTSSDIKSTTVTYTSKSVFPTGFAEIINIKAIASSLAPIDLPLTFI